MAFEEVEEVVLVDEVGERDERIVLTAVDEEHTSYVAHILEDQNIIQGLQAGIRCQAYA